MDDRKDTKAPEISALEKLGRAVEFTRLNRINASTRLLSNERFVQSINIYYSCAAAIVTVLSLIYPSRSFGVVSAVLTVILAISIVYLNAQKYGSRAQQLQANFIALQQLGYDISRAITKEQKDECEELQKRYIELLKTSENHIQHDHFHTLEMQDRLDIRKWENRGGEKQPKPRLRDYEKKKFWFEEIGFIVIKGDNVDCTDCVLGNCCIWLFMISFGYRRNGASLEVSTRIKDFFDECLEDKDCRFNSDEIL